MLLSSFHEFVIGQTFVLVVQAKMALDTLIQRASYQVSGTVSRKLPFAYAGIGCHLCKK